MARIHGEDANYTLNSVAIEDELNSIEQTIEQDVAEVTAFADAAKEFVRGKYGWGHEIAGAADFDASQGDETIWGAVGGAEVPLSFDPTGAGAGANDPNYDGNAHLKRYSITASVNAPATYRATLEGNGALSRNV